jgi:hypothetical protein
LTKEELGPALEALKDTREYWQKMVTDMREGHLKVTDDRNRDITKDELIRVLGIIEGIDRTLDLWENGIVF